MIKNYDKEYFINHRGCYDEQKMSDLCDKFPHATIEEFLEWDISLKDKLYFVRNYTDLTIRQKQELALICAKVSLEIYEKKYPNDSRVRDCVNATQHFLDGKINKEALLVFRNAADAATYAADAAAYAAAAAATAAAYAADAAAYAAAAAATAAAYATYAAAGKYNQNKLLNALKEFCQKQ